MTNSIDEQIIQQMKTSMDELLEQMKVRLCEAVDRVIDKVFSDFNTNKLVQLKSSEKFHDPDEVDVLSELSDRSIQLNSESKENLPLIQEVDSQNETTESLKIDSRKSKVEPQCFDCNEFWAWHQGFINFSRKLKDVKGNLHMAEMQLRFNGKKYSDTLTTTDPYGFRLLVMERSIASWTAMIGGFTWYNPYEKTPLFLLVVYGEMFHVAKAVLDKNFHPTVIYQAHNKASEDVIAVFHKIAISIDVKGGSTMLETVKSCIGTKFMRQFGDMIDALVIDVVDLVQELQELLEVDNKRYVKIEQVSFIVTSLFSTMSNSIDESQKLFDEKSQRTVYFCYSTLRTCSKQKQWERTWACFKYLIFDEKKENNEADNFTVTIVLKACAGLQLLKQGKILHGFLWKNRKMFVGSTLIEFYLNCGEIDDAFEVFKEFEKLDVVLWTSMVSGYEQSSCLEKAFVLLSRMVVENGVHPDIVTFNSLDSTYAMLMNCKVGRRVYSFDCFQLDDDPHDMDGWKWQACSNEIGAGAEDEVELQRACIYTVPKHISYSKTAFESKEVYWKANGYQEDEGKIESTKDYFKQLESYMKLYRALVLTKVAKVASDVGVYYVPEPVLEGKVLDGSKIVKMVAMVIAYLSNMVEYATSMKNAADAQVKDDIEGILKCLDKERCEILQDCVLWVLLRIEDYFINKVKQLIFTFPEDPATSIEASFLSAPKRFPHPLQFSAAGPNHLYFIMAASLHLASILKVDHALVDDVIITNELLFKLDLVLKGMDSTKGDPGVLMVLSCKEAPPNIDIKHADKVVVLATKNLALVSEVGLGADIVKMKGNAVSSLGFSYDSSLQVTYTVKMKGNACGAVPNMFMATNVLSHSYIIYWWTLIKRRENWRSLLIVWILWRKE